MFGAMKRLIRPGDVSYDVGANVGLYARFMADVFGAAQVFAFEPMRDNSELLTANAKLSTTNASKIRVLKLALGDRDDQELLQVDDMMSASAVLDRVAG